MILYGRVFLFICLLSSQLSSQGQPDSERDSLERLLADSGADTVRVHLLNELSLSFRNSSPDTARMLAEEAYQLARSLDYAAGLASSCSRLGYLYHLEGTFDKAEHWYREGIESLSGLKRPVVKAGLHNNLGLTLVRKGDLEGAYEQYLEALEIREELGDRSAMAKTLNNLGSLHMKRQQPDKAKEFYLRSFDLYREENDRDGMARGYYNLGNLHLELGERDEAKDYFIKSLKIREAMHDLRHMAILYNSLGVACRDEERWDQALGFYEKSAAINEQLGDRHSLVYNYNNKGVVYLDQRKYHQAEASFNKAVSIANGIGAWDELSVLNLNLSKVFEGLDQPQRALEHYKRYSTLRDSLFNEEKSRQLAEMQIRYETEKKERENEVLRQEQALQATEVKQKTLERNALLVVVALIMALVMVIFIALRKFRAANRKLHTQNAVIEEREREKAMLLRELHHRVKNNLQIVSSLLSLQSFRLKDKEAVDVVREGQNRVEAMSLIHRNLYQTDQLTHIDMPDYLQRLLAQVMQSYGFREGQVHVDWHVAPLQLEADRAVPLGLILNEVFANAFKYAFREKDRPELKVTLHYLEDGQVLISIRDNGPGLPEEALKLKSGSFGMQLISSLAKQLRAGLEVRNDGGACFELLLPPFRGATTA